ncbi:MAG: 30S ribosomal protein S5 [Armatimonadia bacterium]|nr:30S ribosomal protein S5 [Armatimonadia bacterium]
MSEKVSLNELRDQEFEERVIHIDRVKKTVKGGDLISFRALVAVGNKDGVVGFATGKARATPDAIAKGFDKAKKNLWRIPLDGVTIPHQVQKRVGGAIVFMKPASRGTGVIAGGAVRAIVELAGINDILSKCLGANTAVNNAAAAFECLKSLWDAQKVADLRGKTVAEILGETESDPAEEDAELVGAGADDEDE